MGLEAVTGRTATDSPHTDDVLVSATTDSGRAGWLTRPMIGLLLAVFVFSMLAPVALGYWRADRYDSADDGILARNPELEHFRQLAMRPRDILKLILQAERYSFFSDLATIEPDEFARRVELSRRMARDIADLADGLQDAADDYAAEAGVPADSAAELTRDSREISTLVTRYFDNLVRKLVLIDLNVGHGVLVEQQLGEALSGLRAHGTSDYLIAIREIGDEHNQILEGINQTGRRFQRWQHGECQRRGFCQ